MSDQAEPAAADQETAADRLAGDHPPRDHPPRDHPPADHPPDRSRVAALVKDPHADTLAPFALRADRQYVFSPDGRAVVAYRRLLGVGLVGGDPVGAPDALPGAVAAFLAECRRSRLRPAVLGAGATAVGIWRGAGLRAAVDIGDEAVLDVATFSLASRRMRNLRQAVRRSMNAGVTVEVTALDSTNAARLRPVLDEWLAGRGERGFSMNLDRVLEPRDDCVVAIALDRDGRPQAFARFAVAAGGRTLTLDVAPRRRDAPNGVVERLMVEMVEYGRRTGALRISLNFAGLRRVLVGSGPLAAVARLAIRVFDPLVQLRSLHRFLAKFDPRWQPRWVVVRSFAELPLVVPALLVAEFRVHRDRR